jgi:hypothetical protein
MTICATSDCGDSEKNCVASKAKGQSASASWRRRSERSMALCEVTSHGFIQPMPCTECGLSPKFACVV